MSPRVMQPRVLHQPRVAWDFALITVMMAEAEHTDYTWFAGGIVEVLGTPGLTALDPPGAPPAMPPRFA